MQQRIALLNASSDDSNTARNFRREIDADLVEFDASNRSLPETFAYDAAVLTGSRASVYWDDPWIADLKTWVGEAIERDMPILGVCYGHQLLADVLGGTVEDMGEYELGYRAVTHDEGELLAGVGEEFTVFTTHSDTVTDLPSSATITAENDYGIHGFRDGHTFGVQFHPEYDTETAREVTEGKRGQVTDERVDEVLAGITDEAFRAAREPKALFENFRAYVADLGDEPSDDEAKAAL